VKRRSIAALIALAASLPAVAQTDKAAAPSDYATPVDAFMQSVGRCA